jgi:gluconolactonase
MISDYEILDARFSPLINPNANVERLWTGGRWTEGPAYFRALRGLVWSDLPNDRMLFRHDSDGHVSTFRQPSDIANGNTIDREGRLVTCEHLGRRVTRTEHDGSITVIADRWQGKRLNSPNDVVVKSDGSIWFTDPSYGIVDDYQGRRSKQEIDGCRVYRVDPASGEVTVVADDFLRPNGLAFSPDERMLYVVDSGRTEGPENPVHIRAFSVEGAKLSGGQVFAVCDRGLYDGLRFDEGGRLWATTDAGVDCYEPDGTRIGRVLTPEPAANLVFGGPHRNRLFITATTSLYAVYVMTNGARAPL